MLGKKLVIIAILLLSLHIANAQEPSKAIYRIAAGGTGFTDTYGNVWQPDTGFYVSGQSSTSNVPIRKTDIDELYQSSRFAPIGDLRYTFPLKNGNYQVILHFSETSASDPALKQRWFDVQAENKTVLWGVSIYKEAQVRGALIKTFDIDVQDEKLDLVFQRRVGEPKVSGIEIIQKGGDPALGLSGTDLSFNETEVGNQSEPKQIVLRNLGGRAMTVSEINLTGDSADFSMTARPPYIIPPESGVTFETYYEPKENGGHEANIRIVSDDPGSPHVIKLRGGLANTVASIGPGLIAQYFSINKSIKLLGQINPANKTWQAVVGNVDFSATWGGIISPYPDNFFINFNGLIRIDEGGNYDFFLTSDDGSKLLIDGNQVILNDGRHWMRLQNGSINLTKGFHNISIDYFERTGQAGIILEWKTPSGRAVIPSENLFHEQASLQPFINEINDPAGPLDGGNTVIIRGSGFPKSDFNVSFAGKQADIIVSDEEAIQAIAPKGNGKTSIKVSAPFGDSNLFPYSYGDNARLKEHIRINAGDGEVIDNYGNAWMPDFQSISGKSYFLKQEIQGTNNDVIYQTYRDANSTKDPIRISINLPKGEYDVNLHFAELSPASFQASRRIFNVTAEEKQVIAKLDVYAQAGRYSALVKTFPVNISDGSLDISLNPVRGNPMISGIEVMRR